MNRFFILLAMIAAGQVDASFVGCPANPAILEEGFFIPDHCWSSVHAAVSGDILFNKILRPCRRSHNLNIKRPEMKWSLAVCDAIWDIRERASIHLFAGPAIDVKVRWQQMGESFCAPSSRGLFWGASSKVVVLEMKDTSLGVDFHGGGLEWARGVLSVNETPRARFSSRFYFWQIAAGLSQNVGIFRPYAVGVVDQMVCIVHPHGWKKRRFYERLQTGMAEGCSLTLGSRILLNVEARQFFESGLTLSGEVRF
jgi:hypothetical protein